MAKKNADKSYGWYKAQDFGDYIERVVGEINIKLVSIVITNIFMSGEYGQELEKKKFEDKDETDYLDSLHFCADLAWNGGFDLSFIFFKFSNLDPHPGTTRLVIKLFKQVHAHPWPVTALANTDVLDTVLLSLHPAAQVKTSKVSEQTKEGLKELHSFSDLIHLEKLSKEDMEHLLENLPNSYACQLGELGIRSAEQDLL